MSLSATIARGPQRTRRDLLSAAATAPLLAWPGSALAAIPANRRFEVYRKGDVIGTHSVAFSPAEGGFVARTTIAIAIKIAFVTAFRFEQTAEDTWLAGRLTACRAQTNDDGRKTTVSVEQQGERLVGSGPRGPIDLPMGILNDLSWWNFGITHVERVLDAQNGGTNPLATSAPVADRIEVGGRSIETSRFEVTMGTKHSGSSWYDAQEVWVRTVLRTRGEEMDYRLVA